MGYFDALTSSAFKTTPDGRRLFFPYGVLGGGYLLASEQDYWRLQRQVKIYMIVTLVLIIGASATGNYVWAGIIAAVLIAVYVVWTSFATRGLAPSDERLSLTESMTTQARTHNVGVLWALEIVSLLFVAGGIFILMVDPASRLLALVGIGFFGMCAIAFARMLMLRR